MLPVYRGNARCHCFLYWFKHYQGRTLLGDEWGDAYCEGYVVNTSLGAGAFYMEADPVVSRPADVDGEGG